MTPTVLASVLLLLAFAFWLGLFVDCFRHRAQLTPMLGSQRFAFALWTVLFLACNPILAALYALFGRSAWSRAWKPWNRQGLVLIVALFGIALQFGTFGSRGPAIDVKANPLPGLFGMAYQANQMGSNHSVSTRSESGTSRAPKTIRVTYSDGELSWLCARQVATDFANESWTESVELWPREHLPEEGALAPDLYVDIAGMQERLWPTPLVQSFKGQVHVSAASVPFPMGATTSTEGLPPMGRKEFKGEFTYQFRRFGFVLGADVLGTPAQSIAASIKKSILEPLGELAVPGKPSISLPGSAIPGIPLELPKALLAKDIEFRGWEHGPFIHSRAYYRFHDERPFAEVLVELSEALAAEGWGRAVSKSSAQDERSLTVRDGARHLRVGKWPAPEWRASTKTVNGEVVELPPGPTSSAPFMVTLESRFSTEEYEQLARQYLQEPLNAEGLGAIRTKLKSEDLLREVDEHLEALPEPSSGLGT